MKPFSLIDTGIKILDLNVVKYQKNNFFLEIFQVFLQTKYKHGSKKNSARIMSENFKISKYIIFHLFFQLMTRHGQASACPVKMTDSLLVKQTGTLGRHISCMQKRLMLMHAHA